MNISTYDYIIAKSKLKVKNEIKQKIIKREIFKNKKLSESTFRKDNYLLLDKLNNRK